jgi:hypothetical protein
MNAGEADADGVDEEPVGGGEALVVACAVLGEEGYAVVRPGLELEGWGESRLRGDGEGGGLCVAWQRGEEVPDSVRGNAIGSRNGAGAHGGGAAGGVDLAPPRVGGERGQDPERGPAGIQHNIAIR